ncbi:non-ribosomal peptide synthase/polyketide synthase [Pseudomonas sp. SWRI18]|uniref:non-ribosomal peptide synthase/polyketide synthase n=1 Tax=Pseudomonas sp. SWRI18 TaxID=2753888 RepID=UPI00320B5BBE
MQALIESVGSLSAQQKKALAVMLKQQGINLFEIAPVFKRQEGEPLRLSYAQERQWFLWQLEPQSSAYHLPRALRLKGRLDRAALQRSFDSLIARHESLRTYLHQDVDQVLQVVRPELQLQIAVETADAAQLEALVQAEAAKPFDLQQGPLLRVKLLQLTPEDHVLVLVLHHIVSDGVSMQVMVDELVQLYVAYSQGQDVRLPDLSIQYPDYALWQRSWMEAGEKERQLGYWCERLGGEQPVLELPLDHPRPAVQSYRGARLDMGLDTGLVTGLKALAQREGVTLFMLLLASFQTLLYRYSGQSDIRVGVPIANRNRAETERLIGFFVNTQVLKADIDGQMSFSQLLVQVKQRALEAQSHQDLPFEQLVEALQPERSLSHNPLFQVMFNHQTEGRSRRGEQQLPGLGVEALEWDSQSAQFDLSLDTQESPEGIWASLTYATDLFDPATVQRMAGHWQMLLRAVVGRAGNRIAQLGMLVDDEQRRLLQEWNRSTTAFEDVAGVHGLFQAQARQRPDAIALCLDGQTLSYAELNLQANRLAHCLIGQGVGPEVLVGVAVARSFDMVVSLLAVLKAGGAYVPLDPHYPRERLLHMLEDSGVRLVLTQSQVAMPLPQGMATLDLADAHLALCPESDPQVAVSPQNLAYVIYTSGSTGKPKGVAINHAALTEFSSMAAGYSRLTCEDRVLQFATLNFDGFVEQLYPALTHGATVVLRGPELWDSARLYEEIIAQGITLADLPTAYWNLFLLDCLAAGPRAYGALRQVHIGGEAMPLDGPAQWIKAGLGQVRLLNTYGPTEATVVSSVLDCTAGTELIGATASPIGRSLPGRALYVLDRDLNLAPLGAVGELYIGSRCGLARAYLNRAALTAERFVPDPFDETGARLYRTGDLARYRADGVIEYVGRVDHQVKIRGFRIELGEIEALLLAQEGVRETSVLAVENQLVAYLVAEPNDAEALKSILREQLPDYMVPAHLVFLERMPLNPNGKLDRQALPKPDASQSQQMWVAPATELEQQVAAVWAQILGVERVGLTDHFFEMGGHSLLAMQVVSRLRHVLAREVPLKLVFEQPRLEGFAAALQALEAPEGEQAPPLLAVGREQPLPLSYAQERQWFLWQLDPDSAAYHIPSALRLKGTLDVSALQRSFDALLVRHESLRTCVQVQPEGARQVIRPDATLPIRLGEVDEAGLQAQVEAEIGRPFDLQEGPLLRVTLLRLAKDDHVLVLVQHHIVSDGWSMQVMVDELVRLYAAFSQGQVPQLPGMPIQYADYAVWQRRWMEAGEKARQFDYWREMLGGEQPVLELPFDHQRPAQQSHRGARLDVPLPATLAADLKALAQAQGVTLFMLLLASFQTLLHRYSGQQDIRVGVPIANRNRVETERLIGFFVNTQVLKADIDGQTTVAQLLAQVKQRALDAQAHQDLPFEQLVEALQPERSLSLNPLFQVMFNHQAEGRPGDAPQALAHLRIEGLAWDRRTAHFDLDLDVQESAGGLWASLGYATDLFEASTIERMARHWQNLLQAMVADQQQTIGQLNLLGEDEQQHILQLWNQTDAGFSSERLVHERVADRAAENPQAVAVKFDAQTLTYGELDRQVNRLAHALIARGVGPEARVAIAMPRSAESLVAFLAVMKAGGVYVPLDVEYPRDRLLYMMQDSRAKLLLTHSAVQQQLPIPEGLEALAIDRTETWADYSDTAPQVELDGDNLAYVIYTSGSTGMPKGVAVSHGPLVAHIIATGERYETSPADCELHFMSFAFDGAHEGWMHPLINGASVLIRDDSLWLPEYTYAQMHRHNVTMAVFPPVYLQQLAEHAERDGNPPKVRVYCFGGDAVAQASYDLAWRALKPTYLFNGYGPTETVVTPLLWKARRGDPCGAVYAPIGTLLGNRSGYVLDAHLNLQPIGVAGELYLGGEGVARGYLERAALTAERFVPDPFGKPGSRVYRSGDLTRGRADGVVDYLGRVDHQVKIRGFRIELGEIEARLREQDSVGETVVVAQEGPTGKQLVAYVVPADTNLADQAEFRDSLRRALKARLPDYMMPAHFMFLAQMPLTPNGKLDRKGLPQPDAAQSQGVWVEPVTALQQQVAAIWAEVLGVERVGLVDNFFELGGHSLLVMQVISRLRQLLAREVALRTLFEQPQLEGFVLALQTLDATPLAPPMHAVARDRALLLSYAQERQWFLWQLEPDSAAYHVPTALRLSGQLDRAALQRSFDALLARHETLRTVFVSEGERTVQRILPASSRELDYARFENTSPEQLQARVEAEIAKPFDLRQGPLLRVTLLQLSELEHVLVVVQHHIVSDGWSMQVMVDELVQLYAAFSQGQSASLPPMALQYADYAAWQRDWMEAGEKQRQMTYWRDLLGGEQPVLELPLDHPRPVVQSYRGARLNIGLEAGVVAALKALAQREGVTLFMLLLASFQTLLHRYSGQSDIRVGVPIANRNRVETERLIGFFVNTQVLKADIDGQMTFAQLLQQAKRRALDAQAHQDLPFEQLVQALQPERSLSLNPLFQVMFNHQSEARVPRGEQLPGLRVEGLEWDGHTAHFDLSLDTQESAEGLWASLSYATDLFEAATVARLAQHWQNLLAAVASDAQQPIAALALLGSDEQQRLLHQWNAGGAAAPVQQGVHRLFEAQVRQRPDAIALCLDDQSISYAELNLQANRLAHRLIGQGIGPEVLVGVAVARSFDMVVSLLAVLKAGGAYVPLDPHYPRERLLHMLEDSGVRLVLTQSHVAMPLPEGMATIDVADANLALCPESDPQITVSPQNLAYVIYTSGSTGKPKGVAINHAALTEFSSMAAGYSRLTSEDRVLQFATLNFDGFVEQLYPALTHGATVVLRGPELWDSARLYEEIIAQGITLADLPTAYWNLFLLDCLAAGPRAYGVLRQVHIGGEAMPLDGPAQWLKAGLGHVRLLNTYGPTEATVVSSVLDCTSGGELIGATASPIGRSLPGRALYVLDRDLNLAPLGAVGELYIGSRCGLARAYLNRALLTAERFVPDPFGETGERLYRTGDLARYRADGVIEYVGRVDHQVKIRGFRIELGEIEALLLAQDGVRETLVLAADNQLVAYLVSEQTDAEALKSTLREQLPDYMVPAHLIFLERMPLNPNGKLDRQALPKPDASQSQQAWVAPATELEQQIAAVWADILGAERVGLTDHFFDMGGHSLLAMQVVSRLRNLLGREIALRSLFEQPRLQGFVAALSTHSDTPLAPPLLAVGRDQPLPLSYAQERQWFLWQLDPDSAAYHVPGVLRLKGQLDQAALQRSFDTLVARHESLRTHLQQDGERAVQVIAANISVAITRSDVEEAALRTHVEAFIARPFDLTQGPLMRVGLLRVGDNDHVLALVQHHIISDGGSMHILVDELVHLYVAYSQNQAPQLPDLAAQYADYAVWQRNWMGAGEKARQLDYWRGLLGGEQPVLELPLDHSRPAQQSHRGASLDIDIPSALVSALRTQARLEGVTLFMLLLASFQALLHRYSGQRDIRVGVPIANRNRVETERLIGFFVNTQVLKADIDGQQTVAQLLAQVKQRALEAQAHQDLPFEQLVEALQPERNLSFNPLFQVLFNHQTQVGSGDESQQLPGLNVSSLEWDSHTAQFDLSLNTHESTQGLAASLTYATDLFEPSTLARMARHWLNLLQGMAGDVQQRIGQLPLLDDNERHAAVHGWNATARDYPLQRCVHQWIEDQAAITPDAPALVFAGQQLSYAELNRRANRLAHRLIEAGVGPDVLVGLAVQRSVEMVVGLLAVLKAGGAYVPLDPEYPRDRLAYMLQDSGVKLLLTQAHLLDQLPVAQGVHSLVLGDAWLEGYAEHNPGIVVDGENLAYVIYTSGSTGLPKGAGNRHSALTNRLCWMQEVYGLTARDSVLQKTPFSFDVSVWEFFWPLMTGARLVVAAPGDHRDPAKLINLINQERITTLHFVPSMLQAFLQDPQAGTCQSLQRIVCSGEALPVDAQQQVFAKLPQAGLYNLYGPTEAAIDVTHWTCIDEGQDTVPIGEPIANLRTYVLDAGLSPVPVGVTGELYLGGEGLARSYHRRPGLTAERFVPCPFQAGARLYRTGDRVCQRADGVIEYLGRLDHQVKLRGLRIELGEIEARLLEHPDVREATVLVVESQHLVGYVVLKQAGEGWRDRMQAYLERQLPDYMVPAQWVVLEQMPLSPNGKLDRKALPKPDASRREYVAPHTGLEQRIAAVWAQVLDVERVGMHDNFFELGGHSLLMLKLKERLNKACGVSLAVSQLMLHPTVAGQARCLQGSGSASLIVPLNGRTEGTPLYLFHPSFGSVHCYKAIALALREQRPVMGVMCRALAEESAEVPSWAQMIEDYTQQLLSAQPKGAFCLAGWSLGGNLAMEVAYHLEQAGREVESVGWIDAPPPARFTAFWNQGALLDERVISAAERRADMLGVMFPQYAEQIQTVWHAASGGEEERWQHLSAWAESTLGDSYSALKDELQEGGETERSWAIKQLLDERLQDTEYRPIKAPVNCWWAALSEGGMHQALIEGGMREVIGQAGIQRSVVIDTTHHRIVDNAAFIRSFVAALE